MSRKPRGQSLVLGAFLIFVLALCVIGTIQLAHAVHERMRLQDAADASAMGTAVVAARSLNGMAWINRTMISQYVAAMSLQSMVSSLDSLEAQLGLVANNIQTVSAITCNAAYLELLGCVSLFGCPAAVAAWEVTRDFAYTIESFAEQLRRFAASIGQASRSLDPAAAGMVSMASTLNRKLFEVQKLLRANVMASIAANSLDGATLPEQLAEEIAGRTNSRETWAGNRYRAAMTALNKEAYSRIFDRAGSEAIRTDLPQGQSSPGSPTQAAQRLMAELANASRTPFETHRDLVRALPGGVEEALRAVQWVMNLDPQGTTRLVDPMSVNKFLRDVGDCGTGDQVCNYALMNYTYNSEMTRGGALVSVEYVSPMKGIQALLNGFSPPQQMVGIQAASEPGMRYHCRFGGADEIPTPACPSLAFTRKPVCTQESMHAFEGITPYLSLARYDPADKTFHQPDFWALHFRSAEDARIPAVGKPFGVTLGNSGRQAVYDPEDALLLSGFHAVARARAYYHRPKAWAEPPNLFNPFWRAKLEPAHTLPREVRP